MADAHATTAPAETRDVPFARGTMRMGLTPLAASEWIAFGEDRLEQMTEKERLLRTRREQVVVALPGSEPAMRETLDVVVAHLGRFHGGCERPTERSELHVRGGAGSTADVAPLEAAARLVQEDLCVLQPDEDGRYRLTAGCVCFPSNWDLPEKLGQPLGAIHDPVPGFGETLAAPVDRFFARLASGRLVERLNWLVHDSPALFQLGRKPEAGRVTSDNAGDTLWLRTERQVLQRLPATGAVLFTIRTRVRPLREAASSPAKAAELAAALRAMPPSLQSYRHMEPFLDPLLAWLDGEAKGRVS